MKAPFVAFSSLVAKHTLNGTELSFFISEVKRMAPKVAILPGLSSPVTREP